MKVSSLFLIAPLLLCLMHLSSAKSSHEARIKIEVKNVAAEKLSTAEIAYMDKVWKDAYMSATDDDDMEVGEVVLETEDAILEEDEDTDRKLSWVTYDSNYTPRYSWDSVYGFRFNYWCDLCWDDPCWWGWGIKGRRLRGGGKQRKSKKDSSKKKKKKNKRKGIQMSHFEDVFCTMLREGPFEVFENAKKCKVVAIDNEDE